ncbi:hypothetical protein [Weissella confusa]|nr:hypothetical protein [Weissella confusa]
MGTLYEEMRKFATGHGYPNWWEFRKDAGDNAAREALKQIELEAK